MHDHSNSALTTNKNQRNIALVGNPNVGKSVIFQCLTGHYVTVSNYPGTTVDVSSGSTTINNQDFNIIDTPGTLSLIPKSEDEKVARDVLLGYDPYCVLQVGDTKNPRRTLDLTLQLLELGLPMVLVLNMHDEAAQRGVHVDTQKLAKILGLPVVPTVAVTGQGINTLKKTIHSHKHSPIACVYPNELEQAIKSISEILPESLDYKRALSVMLLSGDDTVYDLSLERFPENIKKSILTIVTQTQSHYAKPLSMVILEQRIEQTEHIIAQCWTIQRKKNTSFQEKLGALTIHPVFGIFSALLVLYVMYVFVGQFAAGYLVNFLEKTVFGNYINPWVGHWTKVIIPFPFFQDLLIGEYGLFTMALTYAIALILPIVTAFFLFFGILEDTGYLPRLAVTMDRLFRKMGLNGKAVLPMVLGLGCDTMATLTTRILETKKERVITTLLLTLAVPCSAQLGVILGLLGGLSAAATLIWLGIVVLTTFLVGYLASLVLPGEKSSFILEIPPFRIPKISNLLLKTFVRLEWYVKEAVPMFLIATLILFFLQRFGILLSIEKASEPLVVNILGLPKESASAFLIGFLRRDYGAAGLYTLAQKGMMTHIQIVVSLVTMTLFVPCFAQFLVNIKERGFKTAVYISIFVLFFAFTVGGIMNFILHRIPINL